MPIIESNERDVFRNLAVEEVLLDSAAGCGTTLFLYRNDGAVVIGKNQNPWRECNVSRVAAEGLALARRVSGGGAVYHDPGNLNYSVIGPRAEYRAEACFDLAIAALRRVGVEARLMKSTSLNVDGLKVSGTAFAFRGGAALHHGTLLVSADLDRLRRVFEGAMTGFETHAIPSVPAPVANIEALVPGAAIERVAAALCAEFEERYGAATRLDERAVPAEAVAALAKKRAQPDWVYDRTPTFVAGSARKWRLRVEEGLVRELLPPAQGVEGGAPPDHLSAMMGRRFAEIAGDWATYSAGTSRM